MATRTAARQPAPRQPRLRARELGAAGRPGRARPGHPTPAAGGRRQGSGCPGGAAGRWRRGGKPRRGRRRKTTKSHVTSGGERRPHSPRRVGGAQRSPLQAGRLATPPCSSRGQRCLLICLAYPPPSPTTASFLVVFFFLRGDDDDDCCLFLLIFSLFLCIRLLSSFGIYKSKRAGGCGGGKGGRRAALFIGTQGFACIMRAAFVLPPTSSPAGLECCQPHCPQRCLPLLQGAPRRGHVVRGSRGEKKPPGAPLPPRLRFSQPLTKRWGKGGAGKGGERREKKKKRQKKGHFPPVIGTRSAARQWGRARLAAAPALRRTRRRRRSHDGGYPHTTWSATGSALPAASRPSRRPGHGASAGFHIIKPPDFGGEAISWAGWLH